MKEPITRVTRMHILPKGEPIFSEHAYTVEIDDEAGGEYIRINDGSIHTAITGVAIDPKDWPLVRSAIEELIAEIKQHEKESNDQD